MSGPAAATTRRDVTFPTDSGVELTGTLDLPTGPVRATALFAHCFTCSRESHAATRISTALAERGIAVLRFDFTGLGASEGDFADTTFASNVADLHAAAAWMADGRGAPGAPSLLVGHSFGGAAVIAAAEALPQVRAVAVVGAPAGPEHVRHLLTDAVPLDDGGTGADDGARLQVVVGGRTLRIGQRLIDDLDDQRQRERLAGLRRALLVLHSPVDEIVGVEQAREVFETARHPKSFVALDGADHLLSARADSQFAAAIIATWAARYLPDVDEEPEPAHPVVEEGEVVVSELSHAAGFAHRASTARHTWMLDEPASVGGTDTGPSPYDALLAALGACTSMTMRMYARRKGWDHPPVRVTLTHERQHAADCEACETTTGYVDHLHRVIELDAEVPSQQREALLRIADRCPVHRTLTHEVVVTTATTRSPGRQESGQGHASP